MKNFTLGLNVVLAIAVAVLFYLHFSGKKKVIEASVDKTASANNFKVAYFDLDSLEANYEYMKDFIKETKKEEDDVRRQLQPYQDAYTKAIKEFREKSRSFTEEQLNQKQQEIMQLEKQLQAEQQEKSDIFKSKSSQKLLEIKKVVTDYIADFNKDKRFAYVFSVSADNSIFYYKDSAYNITKEIVNGLNDQYKKKKP
jgi:outer membrane protein